MSKFVELLGSIQEFKAYLCIKKGSAFTTIVHSPMKYVAISKATQHLLGRIIGFIGDRMLTREPSTVLFPTQKMWQWVKEMSVLTDPF